MGFGFSSVFDNDDFFTSGFKKMEMGSFGGIKSFNSPKFASGFSGSSVSTVTKTINGKTVTTKKTTIIKPDGTK